MRRSRMLSDDARLALQLQDEELKAARGMKRVKASSSTKDAEPSAAAAAKKSKTQQEKSAPAPAKTASKGGRGAQVAATPAPATGRGAAADAKSKTAASSTQSAGAKAPQASRAAKAGVSKAPARSTPAVSQRETTDAGSVSFTLEPWPEAPEEVPPLRKSSMTLEEDQTVLNIKRRVVEEAYPGTDVTKVDIRTPSGIKCGQDHSLKYIRTFLWPVSKGPLVLYYCQAADSFL